MKALVCRQWGPPESLAIEDLPEPCPGPGEVLVLPIGWSGEWTIHEKTRKLYFIKYE